MSASLCIQNIDPSVSVVILPDLPRPDGASPMPTMIADEECVVLGYFTEEHDWAIVRFDGCQSIAFGPPNDEAITVHPLFKHGLGFYDCHEVNKSPWIETLKNMNPKRTMDDTDRYAQMRHCIITFHDSMFECIAWEFCVDVVDPEKVQPFDEMMRIWKMPRKR